MFDEIILSPLAIILSTTIITTGAAVSPYPQPLQFELPPPRYLDLQVSYALAVWGLDSQSHLHSAVVGSGAGGQQLSPFCELCRKRFRWQTLCWLHSAFLTRHTAVSAAPAPAAGAELVWHGGTKPLCSLFATQSPMMRVSNSAGVRPNHDWSREDKSAHEPACAHVQIALFRSGPDSLALI